MKGIHQISVRAKRIRFDFQLRRNITILQGDSATGKTTLIDMIQEYLDNPSGSAVTVISDKKCYVLSGSLWKGLLSEIRDGIVFIDEGNEFVFSDEFAEAIRATDNYYVIVAREGLPALPYSVEEIYGIRMSGKYGRLRQTYNEFYHIYGQMNINESIRPMRLITEDSNAGFQFFKSVCEKDGIKCLSAGGKTKLFQTAQSQGGLTLLIADGAAFGAEMAKIDALIQTRDDLMIYLPESFEWMILRSGILEDRSVSEMLDNPENYIESEKYFSWERFFTAVLIEKSAGGYLKYNKHRLNENYKNPQVTKKILQVMKKIEI